MTLGTNVITNHRCNNFYTLRLEIPAEISARLPSELKMY